MFWFVSLLSIFFTKNFLIWWSKTHIRFTHEHCIQGIINLKLTYNYDQQDYLIFLARSFYKRSLYHSEILVFDKKHNKEVWYFDVLKICSNCVQLIVFLLLYLWSGLNRSTSPSPLFSSTIIPKLCG